MCAESLGGLTDGVSPLEMANAYATIVNGGYRTRPRAIKKIEPRNGKIKLPKRWRVKRTKAFEDGVTYQADQDPRGTTPPAAPAPSAHRLPGRRQDRHDRQEHRRLVRRLHPEVLHLGVGRLPGSQISMNGLYFGSNIDGGTYPARDLGRLHEEGRAARAAGSGSRPSEPFQSQAFQGRYAREGADDEETGEDETGTTTPGPGTTTAPPADEKPADPKPRDGNNGGDTTPLRSGGLRVATAG